MQKEIDGAAWISLFMAWTVALAATLGALFVGEVMGQTPCLLCWYQRVFMFPLAVVLGVAVFKGDREVWRYALPLAVAGLLIAGYHVLLYAGLIPEAVVPCGKGPSCSDAQMTIFGGLLPLPILSLLAFTAISLLMLHSRKETVR
ncbi:MAG: disulfide bond formation protein B [Rhizobium sp.]|nr:disulfide bond formation protein B [Rhizobium sp.]